jgi:hypothetical protein
MPERGLLRPAKDAPVDLGYRHRRIGYLHAVQRNSGPRYLPKALREISSAPTPQNSRADLDRLVGAV